MNIARHPVEDSDRRNDMRVAQAARILRLVVEGKIRAFTLSNLSRRGASGRCDIPVAPGTMITLAFEDGTEIAGRVQWLQGVLNGISLFDNVPQHLVVRQPRSIRPRPRRISVNRPATITIRDASRRAMIRNVSTGGMLIETVGSLPPGQSVRIEAGDFSGMGEVRWSDGTRAGIRLLDEICLERFEEATIAALPANLPPIILSPPIESGPALA